MYNEEFKKRYLEENDYRSQKLVGYMGTQFSKVEYYEQMLNKDLYDFTAKEILEYYKMRCSTSVETLMVLNNQFLLYTQYAIENLVVADGQNHYEEFNNEILNQCVNTAMLDKTIFTREQVLNFANNALNPCEAYVALAVFEGISGDSSMSDLVNLTKENYKNNNVYLPSGKVLSVSDELLKQMYDSADLYFYTTYRKNGDICELPFKEDDDRIIKAMHNSYSENPNSAYRRVATRLKTLALSNNCPEMTTRTLIKSGRIDMIKRIMKRESLTAEQVLREFSKEIEYRYGTNITAVQRFLLKYKKYLE